MGITSGFTRLYDQWEISCFQSIRFFGFNFDLIAVTDMSFWVSYCRNMTSYRFFKMVAAVAQYYFRCRICWCPCLQKVKIYQQTKFRRHQWSTYINLWLRNNDFWFGKTSTILEFYFRFRSRPFFRNLHFILHQPAELGPNRSSHCGHVTSYRFIKMAAADAEYYFRFRICWYRSVFEKNKQTSAILEFYFRFRFRPLPVISMSFCITLPNLIQIGVHTAEIWRHFHFSRWRPRPLDSSSGFVFVDVVAFRRSKSMSKPNFVDISQLMAEI